MVRSEALWYVAPGRIETRAVDVAGPGADQVLVQALYSGISRGTERLVMNGAVPESEYDRMRCPRQDGAFPFPVKYGYALVGRVEAGPTDLVGQNVFLLHPHQRRVSASVGDVHPVPSDVTARRACLAANMETALNVIWDAAVAPGEKVLVIGGGVLGLLIAALAARIPETKVTVADIQASRGPLALRMGAQFAGPTAAPEQQDVVIHTSATEAGLVRALSCARFEGRVVEASWFGTHAVSLPLGAAFHSQRLRLISSQVGAVAPSHRAEWTHTRRLRAALAFLGDPAFDALITGEIPFDDAPKRLPEVLSGDSSGLMTVLRYT